MAIITPNNELLTQWSDIIDAAWAHREKHLAKHDIDCWRVLHGYHEQFPGVTIEKFGECAVIDYKHDIREELDEISHALTNKFPFKLIMAKGHQSLGLKLRERVFPVLGNPEDAPFYAEEFGIRYQVNPEVAHNTGLYLDARPVRKWLLNNSENRKVLNLFAFTGSLGVAAQKGGAASVTHVDKSSDLLPRIRRNYEINDLSFDNRCFVRGDIYKHLPRAIKNGQRFDGIILDPPPKVYASRYAKNKPCGQDFHQLTRMCSRLLNPMGWLVALFHRYDSSWAEEERAVIEASKGTLSVRERFTSDEDFPESSDAHKLRVSVFSKAAMVS